MSGAVWRGSKVGPLEIHSLLQPARTVGDYHIGFLHLALVFSYTAFLASLAFAWGGDGHRIVCAIAGCLVTALRARAKR